MCVLLLAPFPLTPPDWNPTDTLQPFSIMVRASFTMNRKRSFSAKSSPAVTGRFKTSHRGSLQNRPLDPCLRFTT